MKKRLLLIVCVLCCAMTMIAQNNKISYQAVVRDAQNRLVANKTVTVTVNIYNGTETTAAYTETQTATTNLNGLVSLQIGPDGDNAAWSNIQWKNASIKTTVTLDGTSLGTLEMPLTAVPYALYADFADSVNPNVIANYLASHNIPDGAEVNVQSDWKQTDTQADDYIKNKPDLTQYATKDALNDTAAAIREDFPTVPTDVSAFNNDIGYLTSYTESQVLSISHDTIFLTGGSFVKLPAGFSGNYHDLVDTPTNVSSFVNDAGYIKSYTETDPTVKDSLVIITVNGNINEPAGSFTLNQNANDTINIVETDPTVPDWAKTESKPTYDYSEITNTPNIKDTIGTYLTDHNYIDQTTLDNQHYLTRDSAVITNLQSNVTNLLADTAKYATKKALKDTATVLRGLIDNKADASSVYTKTESDARYLQSYTETDPTVKNSLVNIKVNNELAGSFTLNQSSEANINITETDPVFTAWNKSYHDLVDTPKNVSSFVNDAGYIKSYTETDPTVNNSTVNIKVNNEQAGSFTLNQSTGANINIAETDPVFTAWNKSYHDLVDTPTNVSSFVNDAGYIKSYTETDPTVKDSLVIITVNGNINEPAGSFTLNQNANDTINIVETDPTVPAWAKENSKPTYDYSEITNTPNIKDTISGYLDTCTVIANMKTDITKLQNGIRKDALCDSVSGCVGGNADLSNYYTKGEIDGKFNDTTKYVLKTALRDSITKNVELTIKSDSLFLKSGKRIDTVELPTASAQVNADWTATSGVAEIKNKPTNLAYTDANNIFSGNNTFSGSVNLTCNTTTSDLCTLLTNLQNDINTLRTDMRKSIDSLKHTIDSLEGVIKDLTTVVPQLSLQASPTQVAISHVNNVDVASVTCSATLTNADGYTIHWKVDGTDSTSSNSTLPVNFTVVGTHKVLCTATKVGFSPLKDSVTITVTKGTPTVSAPTAINPTYNGGSQNLVNEGSTTGGTLQYKLNDGDYSTSIPNATNAGNYTVYYKVVGNDNWNDVVEASVEASIAKAALTLSVSIEGWTSGQTASSPSVTGNSGNGAVTYSYKVQGAEDNTYTTDVPTAAGDYTVRAFVAETDNYLAGTATANFTIAAASTVPSGAIDGLFSVSSTKQVYFSKGNLQAVGTTSSSPSSGWTWQFAEHQYDYIGGRSQDGSEPQTGNNYINGNGTLSADGTVDLFCWSTNATYYGIHNSEYSSTYSGDFYDWGNAIGSGWRTLTPAEWEWILGSSASPTPGTNCRTSSTVNGVENARYAKATVVGKAGLIIFPDSYTHPGDVTAPASVNTAGAAYTVNSYDATAWGKMEAAGAVFLPATGSRNTATDNSVQGCGVIGGYWSSVVQSDDNAYCLAFQPSDIGPSAFNPKRFGASVRLVKDVTSSGDEPASPGDDPAPTTSCRRINLGDLTDDFVAQDCDTLTGSLDVENYPVKISIADGATVTLRDATINGVNDWDYEWAGVTCLGNATIILEGTNTVKGFSRDYPGIQAAHNNTGVGDEYTLTIQGTGSLTASSNGKTAGIGAAKTDDCGNITISGGTIIATGGDQAAGIGSSAYGECGNITISGGNITASGGDNAAGIGSGEERTCGNITISGGTITATGNDGGAGIGTGGTGASCGNIFISGGTITATGGSKGAGIGTGKALSCGSITITSDVNSVTATKGASATNSIGVGGQGTCGTVTIGGTVYYNGSSYQNGGDTYLAQATIVYPVPSFTINGSGTKVVFAPGNLQATYDGSSWSWAFATNQWDYIGYAEGNTKVSGSAPFVSGYSGTSTTVDLFGWVGSSSNFTSAAQYGISNSTTTNDANGYGKNASEALKSDWGNTIGSGWRTLSIAEWQYVFGTNEGDKRPGSTVNGTSNARYTHATINTDGTGVNGMILFPDGVTIADSEATSWGNINNTSAWGTQCTSAQWTALAAKGCVFLPAAGNRHGTSVFYAGSFGFYRSSSPNTSNVNNACSVIFGSSNLNPSNSSNSRCDGYSVRLVKDAN